MNILVLLAINALIVTAVFHLTQRTTIWLARGDAAVGRGDLEAAQENYRAILRVRPRHRQARLRLARVLSWQQQYPEAIELYYELLGETPHEQ